MPTKKMSRWNVGKEQLEQKRWVNADYIYKRRGRFKFNFEDDLKSVKDKARTKDKPKDQQIIGTEKPYIEIN